MSTHDNNKTRRCVRTVNGQTRCYTHTQQRPIFWFSPKWVRCNRNDIEQLKSKCDCIRLISLRLDIGRLEIPVFIDDNFIYKSYFFVKDAMGVSQQRYGCFCYSCLDPGASNSYNNITETHHNPFFRFMKHKANYV